jgi:CheY-like chemotaxis protein
MSEKPTILTVDDESFVLDIMEMDLQDAGYEVVRAENGKTALNRLREMPHCEAIVLDRMMPEMDGMAVLKELKSSPEYCDIPVIFQTADGQSGHKEEGLKAGAYGYIIKPYSEKTLIGTIQAALRDVKKTLTKQDAE